MGKGCTMKAAEWHRAANVKELVLFGLVLVMVTVSFFRLFYSSQSQQVTGVKRQVEALEMEREALKKFLETTPKVFQDERLNKKMGLKARILQGEVQPAYRDIEGLLTQLTDPVFLSGVVIEQFSYRPRVDDKEKGWSRTEATLNLVGSFSDVVGYLERLEQFPALFSVENVSFDVPKDQPQELKVEVQGVLYQLGNEVGG